jgi:hypothetical protein
MNEAYVVELAELMFIDYGFWRPSCLRTLQNAPGQNTRKQGACRGRAGTFPFGTLLLDSLVLAAVLSAILMVVAQGPSNPIP